MRSSLTIAVMILGAPARLYKAAPVLDNIIPKMTSPLDGQATSATKI
jgi:hypothetical protein